MDNKECFISVNDKVKCKPTRVKSTFTRAHSLARKHLHLTSDFNKTSFAVLMLRIVWFTFVEREIKIVRGKDSKRKKSVEIWAAHWKYSVIFFTFLCYTIIQKSSIITVSIEIYTSPIFMYLISIQT